MTPAALRPALWAATVAVATLAITGCAAQTGVDEKEFTGEKGRVAATVRALDDAAIDERDDDNGAGKVCRELLSKRLLEKLGTGDACLTTVRKALRDGDPVVLDIQTIDLAPGAKEATVKGEIKVANDSKRIDTVELVLESRTWKVDSTTVGRPIKDS
ncbi:MAG: hypothetical protein AB7G37_07275 [Solirubrobacteraceae bacterium]